ncbi:hypothetical protein K491DRAFT_685464 [Lophiostoma macrostomum CBS 122681]|uniref:Uncharacterized protein n=1 Tax=Lophiostoma macrostomum CBS 122681 TaxID=1314788 RepID=A0A6A6SMU9_9PLEO|nr:hypothetical protein K491DRAFT_685464 [Lophiostoma macrostomum CBS 122681]
MDTNGNMDPLDLGSTQISSPASAVDSPFDHKAIELATNSPYPENSSNGTGLPSDLAAVGNPTDVGIPQGDTPMPDSDEWVEQQPNVDQVSGEDVQATQIGSEDVQANAHNAGFPNVLPVPDLTEEKLQKIPQIKEFWDAYVDGYDTPGVTMVDQLERAKSLALMLLQHYFPVNQFFTVEPASFDMMVQYGWSVRQAKPKKTKLKDFSEYRLIPREHITGFVVYKTYAISEKGQPESAKKFPHTYLAIVADDPKHAQFLDRPEGHPKTTRGDIMAYDLGVRAKIRNGYGVMMIGRRLELYRYDNDNEDDQEMVPYTDSNWWFDMKSTHLSVINQYLQTIVTSTVDYQNGVKGEGPSVDAPANGL